MSTSILKIFNFFDCGKIFGKQPENFKNLNGKILEIDWLRKILEIEH